MVLWPKECGSGLKLGKNPVHLALSKCHNLVAHPWKHGYRRQNDVPKCTRNVLESYIEMIDMTHFSKIKMERQFFRKQQKTFLDISKKDMYTNFHE